MKEKIIYIFWGVVFLLTGVGLLTGYIDFQQLPDRTIFFIEIVASVAFVVTYFLVGTKKWGWLLPAFVLVGMAVDFSTELYHTFLSQINGVPIMIAVALWFLTGFLIDRRRWGLLIPAYILVIAAVETEINTIARTLDPAWPECTTLAGIILGCRYDDHVGASVLRGLCCLEEKLVGAHPGRSFYQHCSDYRSTLPGFG